MSEFFSQPDNLGEIRASDLHTSLGERIGAQAGEASFSGVRTLYRNWEHANAEASPYATELPIADAKLRVKQEGLEGHFKLPEQATIKAPVLDLMIAHAHERRQYDAAVARGPQGFWPGALGFITELGAGIIDPVNAAAFAMPVVGGLRLRRSRA